MGRSGPLLEPVERTFVQYQGRKLVYFGGCDYYRLSSHPEVIAALREAITTAPANVAASRRTTGNHPLYEQLEDELAAFFGVERALLVATGYLTNLVAVQGLSGRFGTVLIDEHSHPSPLDAALAFGRRVRRFEHRNPLSLSRALTRRAAPGPPLVITDGVFGRCGSLAPLADYLECLPPRGLLLVDDAHGAGVVGQNLRGSIEHFGIPHRRVLQTITLSKAFGVYGGAILGQRDLVDRIMRESAMFAGHTPIPPPLAAGARAALRVLASDRSLRTRLAQNTTLVKNTLRNAEITVSDSPCPIISLTARNPAAVARVERRLLERGIFPSFLRYPGGPVQGYFRFAICSEHDREQLDGLLEVLVASAACWTKGPASGKSHGGKP